MLKKSLSDLVLKEKRQDTPNFVIVNILKEYLQFPVLNFLYSDKDYKKLIFTGGSCLRICYDLPRLSEDLDFDIIDKLQKQGMIKKLSQDLKELFQKDYLINLRLKTGENRIYLKFPILKDLNLADRSESDWLYVKLEFSQCPYEKYETKTIPISKYGYNFVIKNYTLAYLMTGKINAFFNRMWFKGENNKIDIKGRDFYDLYWFIKKGIEPNWFIVEKQTGIKNKKAFKKKVKQRIEEVVTTQKLSYDLKNFLPNQSFVTDFCKNYKKFMNDVLKEY
jgi:predicted nucleotidyltransferase component of viral defense system